MFKNKNKFKPLYKQFLKLRENIQNRKKLWNFKKKKWKFFQEANQKKLNWYRKFKPKDQFQYIVSRYPNRGSSYQKRYKNMLVTNKKFKLFYGGLLNMFVKKQIKKIWNKNYKNLTTRFLKFFENRLDVVLYRARFSNSIRSAKQLILHHKIYVNGKSVKVGSYLLKIGDLITVDLNSFDFIKLNIKRSSIWLIPPKNLSINYKTLQIIFGDSKNTNLSLNFSYHLHLEKIITSYYQN